VDREKIGDIYKKPAEEWQGVQDWHAISGSKKIDSGGSE